MWRWRTGSVSTSTHKPVASIGLGPLAVSPLDMAAAYATFASRRHLREADGDHESRAAGGKVDNESGWGKPRTKRALSEGVAWKVNEVLRQNALSTARASGSGDGVHPNGGKTGTTENHADAWFVGYTRQLSTVVWMGYPEGEIPMLMCTAMRSRAPPSRCRSGMSTWRPRSRTASRSSSGRPRSTWRAGRTLRHGYYGNARLRRTTAPAATTPDDDGDRTVAASRRRSRGRPRRRATPSALAEAARTPSAAATQRLIL